MVLRRIVVGVSLTVAALALPAVSGAADVTYVVVAGDTLSGIANDHGVPLRNLLAANGLAVDSVILPGQQLVVPEAVPTPGAPYTIVAGDTLSGIAARSDVSLSSLLAVNGMTTDSMIFPGTEIRLPAGAVAPTGVSPSGASEPSGGPVDTVIDFALAQVGKPYTFFTRGPAQYDCSGLTAAAYARIGVSLVHHAATQAMQGTAVDFWNGSIRAGDLVFLDGDWNGEIDHVGIALGPTTWVQASQTRDVVMTGPLPAKGVIIAVRRYVG